MYKDTGVWDRVSLGKGKSFKRTGTKGDHWKGTDYEKVLAWVLQEVYTLDYTQTSVAHI